MQPEYFLDHASLSEVLLFLEGARLRSRDSWEQTRLLGFTIARLMGSEMESPEELLPFPWDEGESEEPEYSSIDELRAKIKQKEDQLNG